MGVKMDLNYQAYLSLTPGEKLLPYTLENNKHGLEDLLGQCADCGEEFEKDGWRGFAIKLRPGVHRIILAIACEECNVISVMGVELIEGKDDFDIINLEGS